MGWLFVEREKGTSNFDFFKDEFDAPGREVVDVASSLHTAYVAYETQPENGESFVTCIVCLLKWRHNDLYNFGYKDIDEAMGPNLAECPKRILDALTPLDELEERGILSGDPLEWATEWRERCRENLRKREALRLPKGATIQTPDDVEFTNGQSYDTFIVNDPRRLIMTPVGERGYYGREVQFRNRKELYGSKVIEA